MSDFIVDRNKAIQDLADQLVRTKTIYDMATTLAEYIIKEKERPQPVKIAVSEEEMNAIMNLFRIRGVRADGLVERRGRPTIKRD